MSQEEQELTKIDTKKKQGKDTTEAEVETKEKKIEKSPEEKQVEFAFLFLGIGSLTTFNAILSESFFYQYYLKNHNPNEVFTSINTGLNLGILILFNLFGNFISITKQLFLFQIFGFLVLLLSPFVVIYLEESISYIIVCLLFALSGVAGALSNSSVFALSSFFSNECIFNVGAGQGIAGTLSNVLNFLVIFSLGGSSEDSIKKGAYFFFFISAGIMATSLFLSMKLYKNPHFLNIAQKNGVIQLIEEKKSETPGDEKEEKLVKKQEQDDKKELSLVQFYMIILSPIIGIFTIFIITFIVFPGLILEPKLYNLSSGVKVNTILITFNIFDTVGRKLSGYLTINKTNLYLFTFGRIILVFTIFFVLYAEQKEILSEGMLAILVLLNPALLGLTSGIGCSLAFALAPSLVEDKLKGRAGGVISLFLVIGMFIGSVLSMKVQDLAKFS